MCSFVVDFVSKLRKKKIREQFVEYFYYNDEVNFFMIKYEYYIVSVNSSVFIARTFLMYCELYSSILYMV